MVYSVFYYWFIDWCLEVLSMTAKRLLEDIRHELVSLTGLEAFDVYTDKTKKLTVVWNRDLIKLDYDDLIKRIDKELEE